MRNFTNKVDNSSVPSQGQLGADEFNNLAGELENAILRSGQTLDGASTTQLAASLFIHGVKSGSFIGGGTANAITLTPVSGANGVFLPSDYANMNGARLTFSPLLANTGAVTVDIGQSVGSLLGTRPLVGPSGSALVGGELSASVQVDIVFDASVGGSGSWILLPWSASAFVETLLPRGYIDGFQHARDSVDLSVVEIGAGVCREQEGVAENIEIVSPIQLDISDAADYVIGSAAAALEVVDILVGVTTGGAVVAGLVDDDNALTMPSGWRSYRRIGSVVLESTTQIYEYVNVANMHLLTDPLVSQGVITTTTASIDSIITPKNAPVVPIISFKAENSTTGDGVLLSSPLVSDVAPSGGNVSIDLSANSAFKRTANPLLLTDDARLRIRKSMTGNLDYDIAVHGWIDFRGRR